MAYERFKEKVEKEALRSFEEYDQRFNVHYFCREWMMEFLKLLQDEGDVERFQEAAAPLGPRNVFQPFDSSIRILLLFLYHDSPRQGSSDFSVFPLSSGGEENQNCSVRQCLKG